MRKTLLLTACFFAFLGVVNAQNEIMMTVNSESSVAYSLTQKPTILSYAPTSVTPVGNAGFGGLVFYWGYMFPASMVEEYAGKYITQVAYLEGGSEDLSTKHKVAVATASFSGLLWMTMI